MLKPEHKQFENKVVFISGAASGIGRSAALAFAEHGAKLALLDINEYALRELQQVLDCDVSIFIGDIADELFIIETFSQIFLKWNALDVAFNNAGYGVMSSIMECTSEQWDQVHNVNLKGTWLCMKEQLQLMKKRGAGVIINNASILGLTAASGADAPYCAAKHGVVGLTKMAALEVASFGIRVNCICPASVDTPMLSSMPDDIQVKLSSLQPIGRVAQCKEVIDVVLWLSSGQASFITGVALPIDGGTSAGINVQ